MKGRSSSVDDARLLDLDRIQTGVGDLVVVEESEVIPFTPLRVYYLYDVPDTAERGEHAHKELQQVSSHCQWLL